jgi:lipopolysaccharide transport system ATP-binding protein
MAKAVKIENLSKIYRLGEIGTGTLSHDLHRWWAKMRGKEDPFLKIGQTNDRASSGETDVVYSLHDINFEIEQGDTVGIIGKNGAGKSTLLKILSRVTSPTTGTISVRGRVASLLEVGTGFHPELTGKENIYLNGAILGMRKKEITRKLDEIIDFSGVARYVDTPVKRYSSGMYVRLAFAVAAHLESEILIVDEVLAVGDAEFQKKCLGKMDEVSKGSGKTILFVSHNMSMVQQICKTGIILNNGQVQNVGNANNMIIEYLMKNQALSNSYINNNRGAAANYIKGIKLTNSFNESLHSFLHNETIRLHFELNLSSTNVLKGYSIFVTVLAADKTRIFSTEYAINSQSFYLDILPNTLVRGNYSIRAMIHKAQVEQVDVADDVCQFEVIDNDSPFAIHGSYDYGKVFGNTVWGSY